MPIVAVSRPLREKLGDEAVDSLIDLINQSQSEQKNDILEFIEEKFERRMSEEITRLEKNLSEKISEGDKKLLEKISTVENNISESRAELIKWMFIFWVGQVGVILGILFVFFKK